MRSLSARLRLPPDMIFASGSEQQCVIIAHCKWSYHGFSELSSTVHPQGASWKPADKQLIVKDKECVGEGNR